MKITEEMLDGWGIDPFEFEEKFGEAELDEEGNPFWMIDGTDVNPADGIPDIIAGLVTSPITTNVSQGGATG